MNIIDLFWLFFTITALQPTLRQRMLEAMRKRKMMQSERARNSRVILLIRRQETMRLLGFPLMRYIDINDSEEVLHAIQMTDEDVPLDIVLHTPGGLVLAAMHIARALRAHKGKVTVSVPHYAMSGGTLIALAADEIVMGKHSVLGPIDPRLGHMPAASLLKVVEQKPVAEINDQTLMLADMGRKAIVQVKGAARELLAERLPSDQGGGARRKTFDRHVDPRLPDLAGGGEIAGLPVSVEMPNEVLELLTLDPQPVRSQDGSVEYLPIPRQKGADFGTGVIAPRAEVRSGSEGRAGWH
jgi:ClpP class serine protease